MTRILNIVIYMYIITCDSDTHHHQIIIRIVTTKKCYKLNRRFRNPSYGDKTHEPSYNIQLQVCPIYLHAYSTLT